MNQKPLLRLASLYSQMQLIECFESGTAVTHIESIKDNLESIFNQVTDTSILDQIMELDPALDNVAYRSVLENSPSSNISSNQLFETTTNLVSLHDSKRNLYPSNDDMLNRVLSSQFNATISNFNDINLRDLTEERRANAADEAAAAQAAFMKMNPE